MMNETQAHQYLSQIARTGIVLGLESMQELLKRLGNPQNEFQVIHVAGTNGKGATVTMIASILSSAGYRTGKYTSPAVFDTYEQYMVDQKMISPYDFADCLTQIAAAIDEMKQEHLPIPTVFEVETALAFLYFARQQCELVVLETGMGGADDATNVVTTTLISVFTSIGLDHTKFLGQTLLDITTVKGGIIKPNTVVICQHQDKTVMSLLEHLSKEKNCNFFTTDPDMCIVEKQSAEGQQFCYRNLKLTIPLAGIYQQKNAMVAVDTVQALREQGYRILDTDIQTGLCNIQWPGRFESLGKYPDFILDGAHNPNAMNQLLNCIKFYFTNKRLIYIMGVLADKDYTTAVHLLCPLAEEIYTVAPPNPRALSAAALADCVRCINSHVTVCKDIPSAVKQAIDAAGTDGVVIAFGSLSYLSDVKHFYQLYQQEK